MFERDYIDIENFVSEYDEMNYDPSENQEIEYEITEDGDYWVDDGYDDDDRYNQEDYETSDW